MLCSALVLTPALYLTHRHDIPIISSHSQTQRKLVYFPKLSNLQCWTIRCKTALYFLYTLNCPLSAARSLSLYRLLWGVFSKACWLTWKCCSITWILPCSGHLFKACSANWKMISTICTHREWYKLETAPSRAAADLNIVFCSYLVSYDSFPFHWFS